MYHGITVLKYCTYILYLCVSDCACAYLSLEMFCSLPPLSPFSSIWFSKKSRKLALICVHRLNKTNRNVYLSYIVLNPLISTVSLLWNIFCFYWINIALLWGMLKMLKEILYLLLLYLRILYCILLTNIHRKNFSVSQYQELSSVTIIWTTTHNLWVFFRIYIFKMHT